jgi:hypothetical protein
VRSSERIYPKLWITASLTYSFSLTTPQGFCYRIDNFDTEEKAREYRNELGEELARRGEGVWVNPPPSKNPMKNTYLRRGPQPSSDSYLTDIIMQGDPTHGRQPESLPDVPGRIRERRNGQYR